ncbi:Bcr/CflA family multidrug efflux MFS transporter [Sphingomonas oligophenolica]
MFIPAMPRAAAALGVAPAVMQLTLTIYLAGIGAGQIISGPLSDRFGRRPVLLGGIALFTLGSTICWVAGSIGPLLGGRLIQALGASAGVVVGRSMAGDAGEQHGSRDMAALTAIVLLSPMLAPVFGSLVLRLAGWRAIFAALTLFAGLCGLLVLWRLPETLDRSQHGDHTLLVGWARIVTKPVFLRNLVLGTSLTGGLYIFLTASPFLLVESYGTDPRHLGSYYGLIALGAGCGALMSSRLARRLPARTLMRAGTSLAVLGSSGFLLTAALGMHQASALLVTMVIFSIGGGLAIPNAMVAALAASPARVGTAVSAYGALQMLGNALATSMIASASPHDPVVVAAAITAFSILAAILASMREKGEMI